MTCLHETLEWICSTAGYELVAPPIFCPDIHVPLTYLERR